MDTSGYQLPDLDDVEFYYEIDQLDVDAVFRPGFHTPFSPTAFDELEMGGLAKNSILLKEEDNKENSPPTSPVFERRTRPTALLISHSFRTGIKIFPDFVYRNLFQ